MGVRVTFCRRLNVRGAGQEGTRDGGERAASPPTAAVRRSEPKKADAPSIAAVPPFSPNFKQARYECPSHAHATRTRVRGRGCQQRGRALGRTPHLRRGNGKGRRRCVGPQTVPAGSQPGGGESGSSGGCQGPPARAKLCVDKQIAPRARRSLYSANSFLAAEVSVVASSPPSSPLDRAALAPPIDWPRGRRGAGGAHARRAARRPVCFRSVGSLGFFTPLLPRPLPPPSSLHIKHHLINHG